MVLGSAGTGGFCPAGAAVGVAVAKPATKGNPVWTAAVNDVETSNASNLRARR